VSSAILFLLSHELTSLLYRDFNVNKGASYFNSVLKDSDGMSPCSTIDRPGHRASAQPSSAFLVKLTLFLPSLFPCRLSAVQRLAERYDLGIRHTIRLQRLCEAEQVRFSLSYPFESAKSQLTHLLLLVWTIFSRI